MDGLNWDLEGNEGVFSLPFAKGLSDSRFADGLTNVMALLKTGGLSQALLMAQVAQTKGLDLMVGCYSDSSLLNGAAAQMLPLIRWPDLDSHLNLVDDPFVGLELKGDRLRPSAMAGLGIRQAGRTAAS